MRGVVRKTSRAAGREAAEEVLRSAYVGHLATVYADGGPYVVAVNYGWAGGRIYFHGAPQGDKLENLRREPRVCFAVEENNGVIPAGQPCEASIAYRSAVVFGRARVVEDAAEKLAALTAITRQAGLEGEVSPRKAEGTAVVAIEPEIVTAKVRERPPV
ncbi:MAG: pyridoxamine 5'-phosphate oxidase family protein [Bacillota bacterium]